MKRQKKKINRFKEKFGICEIVYKVILEDHQFNKTGKHLERLQVDMTQAPHALTYAGYDFDKNLLNEIDSLHTGNNAETIRLRMDIREEVEKHQKE